MKNKSVNMKKLIATPFLFCLSLFTFQVQAQELSLIHILMPGKVRVSRIYFKPYQYPLFRLPAYLGSVPVRAPAFRDVAFRLSLIHILRIFTFS